MPSLVTGSSSNRDSQARGMSRINSFQRQWDDDAPSSSALEWSPSPER